jgi:hypothetical protein
MKTARSINDTALRHMTCHYGGMIILFYLKLSYIILPVVISLIIFEVTNLSPFSQGAVVIFNFLLFGTLYLPFYLAEGDVLYSEIRGEKPKLVSLYDNYRDINKRTRAFDISGVLFMKRAAVGLPILVSAILITYFTIRTIRIFEDRFITILVIISAAVTAISLLLIYLVYSAKFIAVKYIYAAYENLSINEIFELSDKITTGKKNYIMGLFFRVIPFYILSLLIFPAIFTIPYIDTVKAIVVYELIENYDKQVS